MEYEPTFVELSVISIYVSLCYSASEMYFGGFLLLEEQLLED